MRHFPPRSGVTLPEIVVILLIIGILTALAAPAMQRWVTVSRARTTLDLISGELARARMLAVERGHRVSVVLHSMNGCMAAIRTYATADLSGPSVGASIDTADVCLRHSGDSIMVFNSRGMLNPPARSIYPAGSAISDSLLMSSAGRIRRNY